MAGVVNSGATPAAGLVAITFQIVPLGEANSRRHLERVSESLQPAVDIRNVVSGQETVWEQDEKGKYQVQPARLGLFCQFSEML